VKYSILSANSFRGGLDFLVLINNGLEYDGSDSGANKNKELNWNRLKPKAEYVKLFSEVSLVFPLIVSETFAKFN
jgi:deoxyhypusine synthase